jgi:hypothetical protein
MRPTNQMGRIAQRAGSSKSAKIAKMAAHRERGHGFAASRLLLADVSGKTVRGRRLEDARDNRRSSRQSPVISFVDAHASSLKLCGNGGRPRTKNDLSAAESGHEFAGALVSDVMLSVLLRVGPLGRILREQPELREAAEAKVRDVLAVVADGSVVWLHAASLIVTADA